VAAELLSQPGSGMERTRNWIEPCDLLLIAGDISFAFKGDLVAKQRFLAGEFGAWLERVPATEVVLVAGNHDQSIEKWGLPEGLCCH
jgi:metallophosphoesterase superfamily enzyme